MTFFTFLRFTEQLYAPIATVGNYSRDKNSQSTAIFGTQANLYGV